MIFTVLITYFAKIKPRTNIYRYYKHFGNNEYRNKFARKLSSKNSQPDCLAQFTNNSEMIIEKSPVKVPYMLDVTKQHF